MKRLLTVTTLLTTCSFQVSLPMATQYKEETQEWIQIKNTLDKPIVVVEKFQVQDESRRAKKDEHVVVVIDKNDTKALTVKSKETERKTNQVTGFKEATSIVYVPATQLDQKTINDAKQAGTIPLTSKERETPDKKIITITSSGAVVETTAPIRTLAPKTQGLETLTVDVLTKQIDDSLEGYKKSTQPIAKSEKKAAIDTIIDLQNLPTKLPEEIEAQINFIKEIEKAGYLTRNVCSEFYLGSKLSGQGSWWWSRLWTSGVKAKTTQYETDMKAMRDNIEQAKLMIVQNNFADAKKSAAAAATQLATFIQKAYDLSDQELSKAKAPKE